MQGRDGYIFYSTTPTSVYELFHAVTTKNKSILRLSRRFMDRILSLPSIKVNRRLYALKLLKRRGVLASDTILACRKVEPGKPHLNMKTCYCHFMEPTVVTNH